MRQKLLRTDTVDPDLQLTFAAGHGLHHSMQNIILPRINVLKGRWRCQFCGRFFGGSEDSNPAISTLVFRPKACSCAVGSEFPNFEYHESFFQNEEFRISGHLDAVLSLPDAEDGDGVGELKSISERNAKEVRDVPDFSHVIQMQTYMWLTGLRWGILIYWVKGVFRSPLIEHYVERDEDAIEEIKNMATSIRLGLLDPERPLPERICRSSECARAESCELRKACFELES